MDGHRELLDLARGLAAEAAALQRVVEGYACTPETDEELRNAHDDARALVEEEPW